MKRDNLIDILQEVIDLVKDRADEDIDMGQEVKHVNSNNIQNLYIDLYGDIIIHQNIS